MPTYLTTPLAQILQRVQEPVTIEPGRMYKQVTVRLFHKGVVLRGEVPGSTIRTSKQWRLRAGLVLVSRIDGRNGAIGLVPPQLDGAIVTNDFWAFSVHTNQVDAKFLDLYLGTEGFVSDCQRASEGTTNRVRLQPDRFLQIEVPLPSLVEQRRIVSRVEGLSAKIEEARRLRKQAREGSEQVMASSLGKVFDNLVGHYGTRQIKSFANVKGGKRLPRGECLSETRTPFPYIRVADMKNHSIDLAYIKYVPPYLQQNIARYTISTDDIYITIAGTIGYAGVVPEELDGANLTENAAKLVLCEKDEARKKFIVYMLRTPQVQEHFRMKKTIAAQPKLALHRIASTHIPLPRTDEQHRIVTYLDGLQAKQNSLKELQNETAAELDALLPSILSKAFRGEL